jgi:hypothetical protein
MEAEMVRDAALASSGLLSDKMYGPSVFPVQPPGIWNMPYNSEQWTTSEGEDRYRRSLYVLAAHLPVPELHDVRRHEPRVLSGASRRTNTPLQALTLLNDPPRSRRRALAGRMTRRCGHTPPAPTCRALAPPRHQLVLSRDARPDELNRLVTLYEASAGTISRARPPRPWTGRRDEQADAVDLRVDDRGKRPSSTSTKR